MIDTEALYEDFEDEGYFQDDQYKSLYRKLQRNFLTIEFFNNLKPEQKSGFLLFIANRLKSIFKLGQKTTRSIRKRDKVRVEKILFFVSKMSIENIAFIFFMFEKDFLTKTELSNNEIVSSIIVKINQLYTEE